MTSARRNVRTRPSRRLPLRFVVRAARVAFQYRQLHRKVLRTSQAIVEARIHQLGEIFAVGIHANAVMSNHVHLVLSIVARGAYDWSDEEVARRWLMLYPPKPND